MFIGYDVIFPDVVRDLLAQEITYAALSIRRLFYFVMGFGETDYFEDSSNPEMLHTIFMLFSAECQLIDVEHVDSSYG